MAEFVSILLVVIGIFSERVDVLLVAALFALVSNVDIRIDIKKGGDNHDG